MSTTFRCGAVVIAAGASSRLGGVPKQFRPLGGIVLAEWSLRAMLAADEVEEVVFVYPPDFDVRQVGISSDIVERVLLAEGGQSRGDSVASGVKVLDAAGRGLTHVIVHDAARPFVPPDVISRVTGALASGEKAVVPGVTVTDTVKSAGGDYVVATVDRSGLFAAQTPQGLEFELARSIFIEAPGALILTDDVAYAEAAGVKVRLVEGSAANFKVTYSFDLKIAVALVEAGFAKPCALPGLEGGRETRANAG